MRLFVKCAFDMHNKKATYLLTYLLTYKWSPFSSPAEDNVLPTVLRKQPENENEEVIKA